MYCYNFFTKPLIQLNFEISIVLVRASFIRNIIQLFSIYQETSQSSVGHPVYARRSNIVTARHYVIVCYTIVYKT